jgi:rhomboid family GlyGly-CTERM serine protease
MSSLGGTTCLAVASIPDGARWRWRWMEVVLAVLVAGSVAVQCSPNAQALLQFDRSAIVAGQWWRLLTGNFVHYGWYHLLANLGTFAALCWMAVHRSRAVAAVVLLSALAIGIAVFVGAQEITVYRGVSGVDCALLAWVLVLIAAEDRGWRAAGWMGVLAAVAIKSGFEAVTGHVLLPTSAPAGVAVVGVTHVAGIAGGALAAGVMAAYLNAGRGRRRSA